MNRLNIEIKARCRDPQGVRDALIAAGAVSQGTDRQVDTYFHVPAGRLKLRQGDIETALIHYHRRDRAGPRRADVTLHHPADPGGLKAVLTAALGARAVVTKTREILFIDNVKFHIDRVDALGSFVEIEAIDTDGTIGPERLARQCRRSMRLLNVQPEDLVACSYGDMLASGWPAPACPSSDPP